VHHRRFFAPVIAARAKHEGLTIDASVLAAAQLGETIEVSVAIG
jgi:hypothetical protein